MILVRLQGSAGSSEHCLLTDAISIKISCAGSFHLYVFLHCGCTFPQVVKMTFYIRWKNIYCMYSSVDLFFLFICMF